MITTIDEDWRNFKANYIYKKCIEKIQQYNRDMEIVDIPEFCKQKEDRLDYQAGVYVDRLISENRLDEEFTKNFIEYP